MHKAWKIEEYTTSGDVFFFFQSENVKVFLKWELLAILEKNSFTPLFYLCRRFKKTSLSSLRLKIHWANILHSNFSSCVTNFACYQNAKRSWTSNLFGMIQYNGLKLIIIFKINMLQRFIKSVIALNVWSSVCVRINILYHYNSLFELWTNAVVGHCCQPLDEMNKKKKTCSFKHYHLTPFDI